MLRALLIVVAIGLVMGSAPALAYKMYARNSVA